MGSGLEDLGWRPPLGQVWQQRGTEGMGGATLEAWRVTASLQGAKRGRSLT